jgi:hypothetical protein
MQSSPIPMTFFTNIEKSIPMFIWKQKRPRIAKTILSQQSNAFEGSQYFTLCGSLVIKTARYWHKNRQEDQGNRIENPIQAHSATGISFLTKSPKYVL